MTFVVDDSKSYRFTIRWGVETDTDEPLLVSDVIMTRHDMIAAVDGFEFLMRESELAGVVHAENGGRPIVGQIGCAPPAGPRCRPTVMKL